MSTFCSLPPLVDGQVRCFLSLNVGNLHWSIPSPPKDVQCAFVWWGQKEKPITLRPIVKSDPHFQSSEKLTEALFPVRCGPNQFSAYLKDMASLHLDIVYGPYLEKFARIEVPDLQKISASSPLNGVFSLISTNSQYKKKVVGKLEISILFKTTSDIFNMTSTSQHLLNKKNISTNKKVQKPRKKNIDNKTSSKKTVQIAESLPEQFRYNVTSPVVSKKDDFSFVVGPGANRTTSDYNKNSLSDDEPNLMQNEELQNHNNVRNDDPKSDVEISDTMLDLVVTSKLVPEITKEMHELVSPLKTNYYSPKKISPEGTKRPLTLSPEHQQGVLSNLLSKGQLLRNEMIKSTLNSKTEHVEKLRRTQGANNNSFNDGILPDELLGSLKQTSLLNHNKHMEMKAVDLLLGQEDDKMEDLLHKLNISAGSVSSSIVSEELDPLHDTSLLSELFYNAKAISNADESSIIFSDDDSNEKTQKTVEEKISDNTNMNDKLPSENLTELSQLSSDTMNSTESSEHNSISKKLSDILPDQLTVEQLTELGRAKSVRLIFDSMILREADGIVYFIETIFPLSIEGLDVNNVQETLRLVSRKIEGKSVEFNRTSVFPIYFNETMIAYWWNKDIEVTILIKRSKHQKVEIIGKGLIKLKKVLMNPDFTQEFTVDILSSQQEKSIIGKLMASISLVRDHPKKVVAHSKALNKYTKNSVKHTLPINTINKENLNGEVIKQQLTPIKINLAAQTISKEKQEKHSQAKIVKNKYKKEDLSRVEAVDNALNKKKSVANLENTLLQSVIIVQEGEDIHHGMSSVNTCNLYFVCRVFWCKEELRSKICWNTNNPMFSYQQVIAVPMTTENINKMCNNFMIIEVWHKSTTTQRDKLIGMSKVSLHQFYLSYRDPNIAETIMKSKYPVISHDGWLPVRNLITSKEQGSLKILFALGLHDQLYILVFHKEMVLSEDVDVKIQIMELLLLHRDKRKSVNTQALAPSKPEKSLTNGVTHEITITIETVKDILQHHEEVWGEADCFVQYSFPKRKEGHAPLSTFQSKMTLCTPSIVVNHSTTHEIILPHDTSLQQMLLDGFNLSKSPGEIVFELWKRHYYPNIRDQLIASASLPIAKLCAMITMHGQIESSSQSFCLPFKQMISQQHIQNKNPVLNIHVKYETKTSTIQQGGHELDSFDKAAQPFNKSVNDRHNKMNTYVNFFLSFSKESCNRTTQIVTASYSPTFNHHVEFPLQLLAYDASGKCSCLTEQLEKGYLICHVMYENSTVEKDLLIAQVKLPLLQVLVKSTGVKGWWPLNHPNHYDYETNHGQVAGGIEIECKFHHPNDREFLLNHALSIGWVPSPTIQMKNENWFHTVQENKEKCIVQLIINRLWVPSEVVKNSTPLVPQLKKLFNNVYVRYKFYDHAPICSECSTLRKKDKYGYTCNISHIKTFKISPTTSFAWNLREEKLEVQFWLSSSSDVRDQPKSTDSLIGSCYVDMTPCSKSPNQKLTYSNSYNLFKASANNICDARARVIITFNEKYKEKRIQHRRNYDDENSSYDETEVSDDDSNEDDILNEISKHPVENKQTRVLQQTNEETVENNQGISMRFQIDEALHLPRYLKGDSSVEPDVYVSYELPKRPTMFTSVCKQTTKPKFNYQQTTHLDPDLLKDIHLEYKVWRCVNNTTKQPERDILIGVAEVDTTTLFVGMKQIIGWYNIHDFNHQIVGQLKIGIVPTTALSPSRSTKYFKEFQLSPPVNLDMAFFSKQFSVKQESNSYEGNSSSMLFDQLKHNLDDLTNMTSKLKERLEPSITHQLSKNKKRNENTTKQHVCISHPECTGHDKESKLEKQQNFDTPWTKTILPEAPFTVLEKCDNRGTAEINNEQDSHIIRSESEHSPEPTNESTCNRQNSVTESLHNSHNQISAEANIVSVNQTSTEASIVSVNQTSIEQSDNEDNISTCDSTDELLEHLKQFEQKYKHLKDLADNDDLDTYTGTIGIIESDGEQNQYTQPCNNTSPDGEVVNVSSSNPSKEDIKFTDQEKATDASILHESDQEISVDFILESSETKSVQTETQPTAIDINETVTRLTHEDGETSSRYIPKNVSTTLPNFFMQPQEMAESMKALRIAANFRKPPRQFPKTNDQNSDDVSISSIDSSPNTTPVVVREDIKELMKGKVPVEASEMARIASIFSSKS